MCHKRNHSACDRHLSLFHQGGIGGTHYFMIHKVVLGNSLFGALVTVYSRSAQTVACEPHVTLSKLMYNVDIFGLSTLKCKV